MVCELWYHISSAHKALLSVSRALSSIWKKKKKTHRGDTSRGGW